MTPTLLYQSLVNARLMHMASSSPHLEKALNIYIIIGPKIKSINDSGCNSLLFTGCHKNGSVQTGRGEGGGAGMVVAFPLTAGC